MDFDTAVLSVIGAAIGFFVLYLVVRAAIVSALKAHESKREENS